MIAEQFGTHWSPYIPTESAKPYVMPGFNIFAADTDDEAAFLASSMQQTFVSLRTGNPIQLPPPRKNHLNELGPTERAILDQVLPCSAIGSPETASKQLHDFVKCADADKVMITSAIFDHAARLRSYAITAQVFGMSPSTEISVR